MMNSVYSGGRAIPRFPPPMSQFIHYLWTHLLQRRVVRTGSLGIFVALRGLVDLVETHMTSCKLSKKPWGKVLSNYSTISSHMVAVLLEILFVSTYHQELLAPCKGMAEAQYLRPFASSVPLVQAKAILKAGL